MSEAQDTFIINKNATKEWCEKNKLNHNNDDLVLKNLLKQYRRYSREAEYNYLSETPSDPSRMSISPIDPHPSIWGINLYAKTITNITSSLN